MNKKKLKNILIGILLILTLPLDIFTDIQGWYPNETIYITMSIISSFCTLIGFFIIMNIIMFKGDENVTLTIAGKKIDEDTIKNKKNMSLIEKIQKFNIIGLILEIFTILLFFTLLILIINDPLNFFAMFKNVGRAQLYTIIFLIFIVNTLFSKDSIKNMPLLIIIITILCYMILYIGAYYITIPEEKDKNTLSSTEFKEIMNNYEYKVYKVDKIDNLKINNSQIYLAQKDNINIYYIIGEKIRNTNQTYESFEVFEPNSNNNCFLNEKSGISGNYKEETCENPNYIKLAYKIKNTMIYVESSIEQKDTIENILKTIKYCN